LNTDFANLIILLFERVDIVEQHDNLIDSFYLHVQLTLNTFDVVFDCALFLCKVTSEVALQMSDEIPDVAQNSVLEF
jgi:hypothetical protein